MATSKTATLIAIAALSIAVAVVGFQVEATRALAVPPPQGPTGNSVSWALGVPRAIAPSTARSAETECF